MNLSDLINLDQQLTTAETGPSNPRRLEEDRRISCDLQSASSFGNSHGDEELLLGWTRNVSGKTSSPPLGGFYTGAVRWTAILLVIVGLLTGVAVASALLRYDGTQPINLLAFLGMIVGIQLLLLPLLMLSVVFRRRCQNGEGIALGMVVGLLHWIFGQLARAGAPPAQAAKIKLGLETFRTPQSLLARVQPMVALTLIQFFGVAFNLAVVATLIFLVLFSDLTFSWGTTIQAEPERIHQITSGLSLPWANLLPQARPSLELVEATRFTRLEGAFVGSETDAAQLAGGWWRFLAAATITYGLLPRLLALGIGIFLLRRETSRALVWSDQVQTLRERLRTPLVTVGPDAPTSQSDRDGRGESAEGGSWRPSTEGGLPMMPIFWAYDESPPWGEVTRMLDTALGAQPVDPLRAGEIDVEEDIVLNRVKEAKAQGLMGGAAVFFEPFEPPKADARRFLARLRKELGPASPIIVFLAEFEAGVLQPMGRRDWESWSKAIHAANDPFLLLHPDHPGPTSAP